MIAASLLLVHSPSILSAQLAQTPRLSQTPKLPQTALRAPLRDPAAPRFFIETISIEGTDRISEEILVSQARLEAGRDYTEAELVGAVARIRRLPFVLDASPRLRRGSERGRYELMLEIVETSRFFSSYSLFAAYEPSRLIRLDPELVAEGFPEVIETESDLDFTSESFELGYRFFAGARGVAFVGVDSGLGLTAGYTRYRLFDSNAFLTAAVRRGLCCESATLLVGARDQVRGNDSTAASLAVGVPLRPSHSLQIEAGIADATSRAFVQESPRLFADLDSRAYSLALSWIFDTTDDPILPRRGSRVVAGFSFGRTEQRLSGSALSDRDFSGLGLSVRTYGPLGRRNGWSIVLDAGYSEADRPISSIAESESETLVSRLGGGLYRIVRRPRPGTRGGELRAELLADYSRSDTSPKPIFQIEEDSLALLARLSYRNRFTVLRFGLGYRDEP